jgi:threonine dehydratase
MSIVHKTPMHKLNYLSQKYDANVMVKREDLHKVRSFKIRGACNRMKLLTPE